MSWTRAGLWVGAAVLVAAGVSVVAAEEKPRYVGDAPSMFAGPPPAAPLPPLPPRDAAPVLEQAPAPAPAVAPAPVRGPAPVAVAEVSGQRAAYVGGFRGDPGPGPNTVTSFRAPAYEDDPDNGGDDIGPFPGDPTRPFPFSVLP